MKKIAFLFFLIVFNTNLWAQDVIEAPRPAAPQKENKILIDELMLVSGYEQYFIQYCYKQIEAAGLKNNWSAEVINNKKLKVNFNDFKNYTIYNTFSFATTSQLKGLIKFVNEINSNRGPGDFFITNSMIQNNLDGFVDIRYIKN